MFSRKLTRNSARIQLYCLLLWSFNKAALSRLLGCALPVIIIVIVRLANQRAASSSYWSINQSESRFQQLLVDPRNLMPCYITTVINVSLPDTIILSVFYILVSKWWVSFPSRGSIWQNWQRASSVSANRQSHIFLKDSAWLKRNKSNCFQCLFVILVCSVSLVTIVMDFNSSTVLRLTVCKCRSVMCTTLPSNN